LISNKLEFPTRKHTMAPSNPPIFTAIEFRSDVEDDVQSMVTQPLLHDDEVLMGDDEAIEKTKQPVKVSGGRFVIIGVMTGFFIQVISLGAYAFMLTEYGEEPTTDSSESNWFVYSILSVLTQVDLVIYVMIWLAFTCTMTQNGMAFVRLQYQAPVKRRSVFVLGVYFLVGIVLGAFVAWTMIDLYLGFPIPFVPIAVTVVVDLVLCYLMVWCYDLGRENTIEDEETTACC
jgi:magnesium-transporting ATPase (P-type)